MKKQIKEFIEIILEQIYSDCFESWETEIHGEVEILINNNIYGYVKYVVNQDIKSYGTFGYDDIQPERPDSTFTLESAFLSGLLNNNSVELSNVTDAVNKALNELNGKTLNF